MTWTTELTYTADGLTDEDTAALAKALGGADIAYAAGRLRVQLEVEATTLEDAADTALRTAAAATGLLKPSRFKILPTEEFLDQALQPRASVKAFQKRWEETRNKAGGRPRRQLDTTPKKAMITS
ncbi:hypothetical protein A7U43_27730 (plasmid) [Mycobacterium adipatum]|uniref:Uncharacterized protein n=1 Tax=Mycobacterium adipatum TaxID=1682113 RepID=A0A172UW47_9MYCO|nr:hypothetical protein [Mycobacterium adipatum]ANE83331.1 hypothetical protein A7U43_27730 [Mycobacterium adipatum]